MNVDSAIRTVSKNMVINFAGSLWQLFLVIWGTRMVLHQMGADSFGLLALAGGTAGYFLYLEIGIGETAVKKISETRDPQRVSAMVSTLFFFGAGFGSLLALLVASFALFGVGHLFTFAPPLLASATRMFLVIAAGVWVMYPLIVFTKVFVAFNRMGVYNALRIVFQTLILAMLLGALQMHNSAESAAAAITVGGILWKLSSWAAMRRLHPEITLSPKLFDRALLRDMLQYKKYATVSQFSAHAVYQCDIYLIGIMLDPVKVTLYTVANTIAMKVTEATGVLVSAVFPVLSFFHGADMREQIRKNFLLSTKILAALLMPVTVILFVFARQIITVWVGEEYAIAAPAMQWLLATWYINGTSAFATLSVKATNRPEIEARTTAATAVANIVLDILFIQHWGYMGAVYATALTQVAGVTTLMALASRAMSCGTFTIHGRLLLIILAGIAASVVYLPEHSWLSLAAAFAGYCALFFPACYWLALKKEERGYLKNMIAIVMKKGPA